MNRKGETITREPGSLKGYDFVIDGCENCEIRLLDHTAQIQVDYCKDSKIIIGPVNGSVFVRNCERCVIFCTCQQLRTRECVDCDFILLIPGHPIIETSRDIRFGALPRDFYPELEAQMKEATLTIDRNDWDKCYNFSPENPPGCTHFTLLSPEDTTKVISAFPASPGAANIAEVNQVSIDAPKADVKKDIAELREVRVTAKGGPQFHANLCRSYLCGKPAADDKPALEPSLHVVLAGAGSAVGTTAHAALLLEKEGVARINSISTGLSGDEAEKSDSGKLRGPTIRIVLQRLVDA